jgi:type IV secretory pathway protease TraF
MAIERLEPFRQALVELRRRLRDGGLEPGARITAKEVAESLRLSPTPARADHPRPDPGALPAMNPAIPKMGRAGWGALAALAALGLTARALPSLALVNESSSLPRGLYLRAPDQRLRPGAVVAVQPPPQGRRYLDGLGMPSGAPLLKRVAAVAGDRVCRRDADLDWPGGSVTAFARDRRGDGLPAWAGCRRLAADELLVLGDTTTSFDSRYFGPVRRAAVEGVYVEALTW